MYLASYVVVLFYVNVLDLIGGNWTGFLLVYQDMSSTMLKSRANIWFWSLLLPMCRKSFFVKFNP